MRYYFLFSTFILLCFSGCKQEAIQLRFVVISDTHFSPWSGHESVPKALKNLLQKEPLPDAVFVVGDLTEHGWPAEYDAFMATFTDRSLVPEGLEVYLMTGNHDLGRILKAGDDPFEHMSATERYMKKTGQPLHQYVDIKGYPFVTVSMTAEDVLYSGLPEEEVRNRLYDEEALRFLEEKLAEAKRDHPGKPIFLFSHIGSSSSCFGTFPHEDGGQTQFPPILDAYPEVVFFNGHSHFPIGDPRTIHQDRYTSINDGSVSTLAGTKYFIPTPHTPQTNLTQISEGLIVNVWTDGRVEIERWDAARDEEILPRWQLEPPFDGSRFAYANRNGLPAPAFDAEAKVTGFVVGHELVVRFPKASDNEVVNHYFIEFMDEDGTVVYSGNRYSDFCLNSQIPDVYGLRFSLWGMPDDRILNKKYKIRVTAVDSYGNRSASIVSELLATPSSFLED